MKKTAQQNLISLSKPFKKEYIIKKVKYFILDKEFYSYPILSQEIICPYCNQLFHIAFASNLKQMQKECPFCKNIMKIYLNKQ